MTRPIACAAVLALFLTLPSAALAGDTVLTFNGKPAKALRKSKVKISAQLPANGLGSKFQFPVAGGEIASTSKASLAHHGELRLKRGKRKLYFTALTAQIGSGRQSLTAKYGTRTVTLFTIKNGRSTATINPGNSSVKLSGASLSLTPAARKLIKRKLRVSARAGRFGSIAINGVIATEPPLLARPATAIPLISATITWHVKESFADYLWSGTGSADGVSAADGAVPGPNGAKGYPYEFNFPMRDGAWYDPASGTADVFGQGAVRFRYASHDIDIVAAQPEIELRPGASRGIYRFGDGRRAVLYNLAYVAPAISDGGTTYTYSQMAGSIPAGTDSSTFAGFYQPGEEFGFTTVSFRIP